MRSRKTVEGERTRSRRMFLKEEEGETNEADVEKENGKEEGIGEEEDTTYI